MNMNDAPDIVPVILCGGSGTRLWPLSREIYPKPFVKMKNGHTLFQNTLERARWLAKNRKPIVVCNEQHRFYVLDTLNQCEMDAEIALEPAPRNTAPAIAIAASAILEGGDALMLVMPSDHAFSSDREFAEAVKDAAPIAAKGHIVTFGIQPLRPETGYGYIEQGDALDNKCFKVNRFVEKPDARTAESMLEQGSYYWNSGIFLMPASLYLNELSTHAPDIFAACSAAWRGRALDERFIRPQAQPFINSPENSIDYAIMEHTDLAAMLPVQIGWSDLGSWEALYQIGENDGSGNVCNGDIILNDVENSYLYSEGRLLAAVGLRDMVVVESRDAVLIMPRDRAQDVKKIVARLKMDEREEFRLHPLVYRPWGSYERLVVDHRFQVKRIIVKPGCSLSLQMHHHRSEHWIVVHGTAEITVGEETNLYTENQSVYIPVGSLHKLRNPGIIPLEIIEVQSGSYLGEDDIVRLEDSYGRK